MNAVLDALKDVSGVIVVKHSMAEHNEKDHLHVYYEHEGVSSRNALDALKLKAKVIFGLSDKKITNGVWAWSNPNTSAHAFWRYAMYEKGDVTKKVYRRVGAECLLWNLGIEKPDMPEYRPANHTINIVSHSGPKLTTQSKMQKFYKYFKDSITPDQLVDYSVIADLLDDYATGGFNENAAPQYIEYVMYNYLKDSGDTARFSDRKKEWIHRVLSRLKK